MVSSKFCFLCFNRQFPYYMYKFIYQFFYFLFNSTLMLRWEETCGAIKQRAIAIILSLVSPFIPHRSGIPVAQLFSWKMAFPPLGIPCVLTILVCTYLTPKHLLLSLRIYIPCLTIHQPFFS